MKTEKIFVFFIVGIFVFSVIAYALSFSFPDETDRRVEGVAQLSVNICNEEVELPSIGNTETGVSANDGIVYFPQGEGITLGDIFDEMNVSFSATEVMGYENNNGCDDPISNEVSLLRGRFDEEGVQTDMNEAQVRRDYELENGDIYMVRYF